MGKIFENHIPDMALISESYTNDENKIDIGFLLDSSNARRYHPYWEMLEVFPFDIEEEYCVLPQGEKFISY